MSRSDRFIHDPLHGRILYNQLEEQILSSKLFNRLHHITQNSTTFFTFPAAKHSRHLHSIGTMHLASQMFRHSLLNTDPATMHEFLQSFKSEMQSALAAVIRDLQGNQPSNPLSPEHARIITYNSGDYTNISTLQIEKTRLNYFDINLPEDLTEPYYFLLQILRLAALLHDVGHPPFSHLVEWSLDYAFSSLIDKPSKTQRETSYCITYQSLNLGDKKFHEKLGDEIAKNILLHEIQSAYTDLPNLLTIRLAHKMLQNVFSNIETSYFNYEYLHKLVDGMIDADRLDYVLRDTLFSGYNAASFDLERIVQSFTLLKEDENSFNFFPNIKAVADIEKFLNARFNLYNDVLFHYKVQKTNTILNHTLVEIALNYLSSPDPECHAELTYRLPSDISGLWKVLNDGNGLIKDHIFSQYDENWLLTILKEEYFRLAKELSNGEEHNITSQKIFLGLEEVLFGKNKFLSAWKRKNQFCEFFNIDPNEYEEKLHIFRVNHKELTSMLKDFVKSNQREDFLMYFAQNKFKNGYDSDFKFYHDGQLLEFGKISRIDDILTLSTMSNVPFFLYSTKTFDNEPEIKGTLVASVTNFLDSMKEVRDV